MYTRAFNEIQTGSTEWIDELKVPRVSVYDADYRSFQRRVVDLRRNAVDHRIETVVDAVDVGNSRLIQ